MLGSGRKVIERTCGAKTARIVHGQYWWTITIRRDGREIDRTSRDTLRLAKSAATKLMTRGRR
jgi:hypothetical protein